MSLQGLQGVNFRNISIIIVYLQSESDDNSGVKVRPRTL